MEDNFFLEDDHFDCTSLNIAPYTFKDGLIIEIRGEEPVLNLSNEKVKQLRDYLNEYLKDK